MTPENPENPRGAKIPAPPIQRVAPLQMLVLLVLAGGLVPLNAALAGSVLLGGLAAVLPQAWFARFVFREQGAQASERFFGRLVVGEATKLSMTALLCVLGLQWPAAKAGAFFMAMAGMMVLGWALTLRVFTTGIAR